MTVYLDIILLFNFLIDWIILWSTAFVLKIKPNWYRLALGASVGAGYTMVLFFPPFSGLFTFLAKLLLSMIMIFCVFGYHRLFVFLKRLLLFYLVAFVLGGGLLGINFYLQSESEILSGIVVTHAGGFGSSVTWGFIAIAFPVLWWLSGKGLSHLKENNRKASFFVDMRIWVDDDSISCRGLIDTGNQLYEPITRIPVTIADISLFEEVIPQKLYQAIREKKDLSEAMPNMDIEDHWLQRVRVIPFRSVSRGMDLLIAIRPDKITLYADGKSYECRKALIGLNPTSLASDGTYQAIVHSQLTDDKFLIGAPETSKEAI